MQSKDAYLFELKKFKKADSQGNLIILKGTRR